MQPIKPVTKDEIEAYKAQFRSIDSRTPKKVAEAKSRKRGRVRTTPKPDHAMSAHSEDDGRGRRLKMAWRARVITSSPSAHPPAMPELDLIFMWTLPAKAEHAPRVAGSATVSACPPPDGDPVACLRVCRC
jgi:hypothetical protein